MLFTTIIPVINTGCSTAFKYTPKYAQTYTTFTVKAGLAIQTGQDARPGEERRPFWAEPAEPISPRLANELRHAKLFGRVKIHDDTSKPNKYPEIVRFRILKFECYNHPAFLENTGRELLRFQGVRGLLIAESIPSKYISEVQVKFEVLGAANLQSIFVKSYSASRTGNLNGYQGDGPKVQQTSEALESVLTQFLADLTKANKK